MAVIRHTSSDGRSDVARPRRAGSAPRGDAAEPRAPPGPGGQHANVTASRVEAIFDVEASSALTDEQKRRVIARARPARDRGRPGRAQSGPQPRARARAAAPAARPRRSRRRVTGRRPARPTASVHRRLETQAAPGRPQARPPTSRRPTTSLRQHALARRRHERDRRRARTRWWKDRDAAMLRLVDMLERWAAAERRGRDGRVRAPAAAADPLDRDRGRARPEAQARTRPTTRSCAACERTRDPAAVRVVTSDRWLADRAWAAGASVEGADSFRTPYRITPEDLRAQSRHLATIN